MLKRLVGSIRYAKGKGEQSALPSGQDDEKSLLGPVSLLVHPLC